MWPRMDAGERTYRRRELIGHGTDAWHPTRGGSTARKLDIDSPTNSSPSRNTRSGESSLLPWIRGLSPTLKRTQRQIAKAILDDPEQFITQSISELAERCGVSAGSVVGFCKSLGLRGFPALKIRLARELAAPVFPLGQTKAQRGGSGILQQVFHEHVKALHETLRLNSPRSVQAAALALAGARRTVLFSIGLSYPVAYSLYARLRFIGMPAFIEYDSHMQLAAAAEINKREVALGISAAGSTSETVECLRLSRARGAKTICITNSIDSPLARAADIKLYAAPSEVRYFQAPLASRLTQLALADALLVILGLQRKHEAVAHLERAEEHLLKRRLSGGGRAGRSRGTGASRAR